MHEGASQEPVTVTNRVSPLSCVVFAEFCTHLNFYSFRPDNILEFKMTAEEAVDGSKVHPPFLLLLLTCVLWEIPSGPITDAEQLGGSG